MGPSLNLWSASWSNMQYDSVLRTSSPWCNSVLWTNVQFHIKTKFKFQSHITRNTTYWLYWLHSFPFINWNKGQFYFLYSADTVVYNWQWKTCICIIWHATHRLYQAIRIRPCRHNNTCLFSPENHSSNQLYWCLHCSICFTSGCLLSTNKIAYLNFF